jgi:hypothetical protein
MSQPPYDPDQTQGWSQQPQGPPGQVPPTWPPAQGPQHGTPGKSWPARHKALAAILAVVAFFAVFGIGAAAGSGGKTGSSAGPAPTVTVTETETEPGPTVTTSAQAAAPSPSATPQQAAHTVATFSGSGQQNTPKFTVTDTWKLKYSFDCSDFGQSGNFQVYEDGGNDYALSVNDLAKSKSASTLAYNDAGSHYLQVNSECTWTMKVIDEPGQ